MEQKQEGIGDYLSSCIVGCFGICFILSVIVAILGLLFEVFDFFRKMLR